MKGEDLFASGIGLIVCIAIALVSIFWIFFPFMVIRRLDKLIESAIESSGYLKSLVDRGNIVRVESPAVSSAPLDQEAAYFIRRDEKTEGPFTIPQLKALAYQNRLPLDSLCAKNGGTEWYPVTDLIT
jgi:hypothetical protein